MASNDWKKKNYNSSVKVSSSTIADLKAGKTFEGNVAKFKSGATSEQREAMNRFYGKSRVDTALGASVASVNKTYSASPGASYKGTASNNYTAPKGQQPTTSSSNKGVGNGTVGKFVKNELLGVDDFKSVAKNIKSGNWGKAAKSLGTGAFEAGSTVAAIGASAFTGGAVGAGYVAAKSAQVAGRQVVKQAVKSGGKHAAQATVKTVASKATVAAGKGSVKAAKTVLTGSAGSGAKVVAKVAVKAPGALLRGTVKAGKAANQARKTPPSMVGKIGPANAKAASATAKSKEATSAYKAIRTASAGKPVKGMNTAYDTMKAAGTSGAKARSAATALRKEAVKKAAKGKAVRRGVRRGLIYPTIIVKSNEKK